MTDIAIRAQFDRKSFLRDFNDPHLPVVYSDFARDWPAVRKWNPEYLESVCGSAVVPINDSRDTIRLGDFVSLLKEGAKQLPYLRNIWLLQYLPELSGDIRVPLIAEPNWLSHPALRPHIPEQWNPWFEFFFSGPATRFPYVHADAHGTHAWSVQVFGSKRFWLWPPSVVPPENRNPAAVQDLSGVFPESGALSVVLDPGDLLFIPSDWWHLAESESASITLSGNFVNHSNWMRFLESYFLSNPEGSLETLIKLSFLVPSDFPESDENVTESG